MQRLKDMTPDDMAAMRDMLSQLNQMLQDQANGQQPDFAGFMQQYGQMFGPNPPQNLEELDAAHAATDGPDAIDDGQHVSGGAT